MATTGQKWLIGCGIGCGAIILIIVLIIGAGAFFMKNTIQGVIDVEKTQELVEARFGHIQDFAPQPDGKIPSENIEHFLLIRENLQNEIVNLEKAFSGLQNQVDNIERGSESFWDVLGMVRKGIDFLPSIMRFYSARNTAFVDYDFSPGEYTYIYVLAYYSWLDKNPGDGPELPLRGDGSNFTWHTGNSNDENDEDDEIWNEDMKNERMISVKRQAGRFVLPMLKNQLKTIQENPGAYNSRWVHILQNEIQSMEDDRLRLPYQDGLPSVILNSLEPYRSRIEELYNEKANAFEPGSFNQYN